MEKAMICGKPCVKRGKFWYAIRRPQTTVDLLAARTSVRGNWGSYESMPRGDNRVIVNQRT